jgi:mono/diheme cytochrome c family protein
MDQELALPGQVNDDDLPRGAKVTVSWKKDSGPGTVTFSSTTTAATRAKFSAVGSYQLELTATDTQKTTTAPITVNVAQAGGPAVITEKAPDNYIEAMKSINTASTALRAAVGGRNYTNADANIATMKDAFTTVNQYWTAKGVADATSVSAAALKSIADLSAGTAAKDDSKLLAAQVVLNRTCTTCHNLHRQRMPDGHFEIK